MIACFPAGDLAIDALKKESESLMIPANKLPDYIRERILLFKDHELELELAKKEAEKHLELAKKEAEKHLELERKEKHLELAKKEAEKHLELELAKKEAEKGLELERVRMNITRTGLLWKLKTQTQRHALELFLFDCWERMQQFSEHEIRQLRMKNKRFPMVPANVTVSAASGVL